MAWVNIPDTATDPDAPLTSSLAKAWTGNFKGMADGDPGAPQIKPLARQWVLYRNNSLTHNPVTVSDLSPDIFVSIYAYVGASGGGSSITVQVRFSSDNGSTFGGWINLTDPATASQAQYSETKMLDLRDGRLLSGGVSGSGGQPVLYSSNVPINSIGFRVDGPGSLGGASIYLIGEGNRG